MFTSRAEYRLILREDNADLRLMPKAFELGLITDETYQLFEQKYHSIKTESERLQKTLVQPHTPPAEAIETLLKQPLAREYRLLELLKRPGVTYQQLMSIEAFGPGIADEKAAEQIEIQVKYAGYIDRQEDEIAKLSRYETLKLPPRLNYEEVVGLSSEVRQKLIAVHPVTIGHASRIPGVTPAA